MSSRKMNDDMHGRLCDTYEVLESDGPSKSGLVLQRQKASDYDNSSPTRQLKNVSPSADTTAPSQQELDLLFSPLYDEFFTARTSSINKSSSSTLNSTQQDTQLIENNDNQAADAHFEPYEFVNPFCTPVPGVAESASRNIDNSNMHTFYQPHNSEYRWTKDHPLEQVHGNPSKPVQTRRQLATDPEMCDKLVSWMSKKQDCTAMSSAEAEYVALSASCAQVMWMRTQLNDYDYNYNKIPLYCDSQSAIVISCNPVQHSRTKHIHTRYHFIKERVENGIIELYFVRTEYQLADIFTKGLPEDRFQYLARRIGMRCLTPAELEVLANESA
ncbi:hypothetical protein Tco_1121614 [Tanacetum coccineum]|uniref:Retrovirus-related Pol polyprotein from transposon TNT 1-94 n=1 Tax=Tanacetum coccineum TaxID=301880 RepID=A0ABQ5IY64_9ASTR